MSAICSTTKWIGLAAALLMSLPLSAQTQYSLDQAVARAQQIDPWLQGSELREQSMLDRGVAAAQLPDPRVSINMANLPLDSLDFGREPMTQLQIGVSQVFPRGEKRTLESRQFRELSERQPLMRADRKARVAANVTTLWLDAFLHAETIRMLEQDRTLFENLVDVVQSRYANSLGKTRQQDLVRAQLELTRLEDRIARTQSQKESSERMLAEWLYEGASDYPGFAQIQLTETLPQLRLRDRETVYAGVDSYGAGNERTLVEYLLEHPAILSLDQQILAQNTGVEVAHQSYKPQWGVNAAYGYRDEDPMGFNRSDFFSIGVSLDIPLFTENRQDRQVQSAVSEAEALKTDRALALRQMRSRFESARAELLRLDQRRQLYQSRLLEEMHQQAEAAMVAYTNDEGDFAEVIRARIDELNARIEALSIEINRRKTIAQLNYFLVSADSPVDSSTDAAARDNS